MRASEPARSLRRPVVEATVPVGPTGLGTGHAFEPKGRDASPLAAFRRQAPSVLLPLVCNGAAALVAFAAAALAALRRRRRPRSAATSPAGADVHHLPPRLFEHRRAA